MSQVFDLPCGGSSKGRGPPGKIGVEHVVNVLGRLNATPTPQSAATTLPVAATKPPVNTARYDSLRAPASAVNDTERADHA